MNLNITLLALALSIVLFTTPADAQSRVKIPCGDHAKAVSDLKEKYGETVHSYGSTSGAVAQMFVSENKSTWTFILMGPNGISCIIAAGTDWGTIIKPEDKT